MESPRSDGQSSVGWGKAAFRSRFNQNCGCHGNIKLPLTYNGKEDVSTLTPSVLIRCLSNLQVTTTSMISRPNSNFSQIGLKISHTLIMGRWCLQASTFFYYRIFVKLTGNQDRHKISDEFEIGSVTLDLRALESQTKSWYTYTFRQTWISLRQVGLSW